MKEIPSLFVLKEKIVNWLERFVTLNSMRYGNM